MGLILFFLGIVVAYFCATGHVWVMFSALEYGPEFVQTVSSVMPLWLFVVICVAAAVLIGYGANLIPYGLFYRIGYAFAATFIPLMIFWVVAVVLMLFGVDIGGTWGEIGLAIPLFLIVSLMGGPEVAGLVALFGFFASIPMCLGDRRKRKHILGFLCAFMGHVGITMLTMGISKAIRHEANMLGFALDTFAGSDNAAYRFARLLLGLDPTMLMVAGLAATVIGFGVDQVVAKEDDHTGLFGGLAKMMGVIDKVDGYGSRPKNQPAPAPVTPVPVRTSTAPAKPAPAPIVRHDRPAEAVTNIWDELEIDGNYIRKPGDWFGKGDVVFEIDGNYVRKPGDWSGKGDIVYEIDGDYIREPSGILFKGNIVYEIDGDVIRKPSGILFKGDEVARMK